MAFDPLKEGATEIFNPIDEGAIAIAPRELNPVEAEEKAAKVWDTSLKEEISPEDTNQNLEAVESIIKKKERAIGAGLGPMWSLTDDGKTMRERLGYGKPKITTIYLGRATAEVPKGVVRFLERDVGGTFGGTVYDWLGQLIEQGGIAVHKLSALGSKDKDRIYNPYAEVIIATGQNISHEAKQARAAWAEMAMTGWEAMDKNLRETDPVSYGAGRLSEGVASSALSVIAMYLTGGATAVPELLNTGIQINKGLALLSTLSAAGGFEHAQNQGENFLWATLHGLADGLVEYAMESTFLEDVGKGSGILSTGVKESAEEFFTGMLQNTRAGVLENETKGMPAYDGAKDAVVKSLRQSPWDMAAGFIGGAGIAGGASLVDMVNTANARPIEALVEPVTPTPEAAVAAPVAKVPAKGIKVPPKTEVALETRPEAVEAFKELGTSQKEIMLKHIYKEELDAGLTSSPTLLRDYNEIKASLTSEELKDFEAVLGIIDKRIAKDLAPPVVAVPPKPPKAVTEGKQPWETSDLATAPNIPIGSTQATKQADGKWKLFFRGTRNEIFQGEKFNSAAEAKQFFKVQQLKAQEAQVPPKPAEAITIEAGMKAPLAEVKPKPTPEQIAETQRAKVKTLTDKALTELGKAERPREIIETLKTKELGKRAARSAMAAEQATGEGRLFAALGQLKGQLAEYKNPDFTPLKDTMPQKDIDTLHDDVWIRPWSEDHFAKLNTAKAWSKVVEGFVPTRGEILLLEKQWGKEFAKSLLKKRPLGDRAWDTAADISNFMRTMIAGGDVSVAGRQLRALGQLYPKEFGKSVKEGLGAYASEKLSKIMRKDYESSAYHKEAKKYVQFFEPAGTEAVAPSERPEWYMSQYPEKIPVLGHIIRMGNRNYVETMNMFTQSIWDKLRAQDVLNGVEPTKAQLDLRGKWLMSMSGRPEIGGVIGRRIAPIASGFFFAPRFAVSRFTSPTYLRHLASGDPVARAIGRKTAVAFASLIGTNIAILALLKLSLGDKVELELDPRSPDWGKGKIGNTRIDLLAGYQQAARFLVQMTLGQYKTQAGKVKETERLDTVGRFIRGKENPLVSLISDLYKGKTYEGDKPFAPPKGEAGEVLDELKIPDLIQGVGKEAYNRMLFMWVQDFIDASINDGWILGFTAGTLSFFGTNTSAYEDTAFTKIAKFKDNIAQTEHGKDWNELNAAQQKRLSRINKQVLADFELQTKIEGVRRDDYDYVSKLIEDEKKAGKKVYKKLKPENRKLLDESGISLGLSRKIGDWEIDDARYKEYQNATAEILDTKLSKLSGMSGWEDIPIKRRLTKVELAVQIAKDKAKNIVRREAKKVKD